MNNTMIEYNEGNQTYYVYIITNKYRSTYYIGMTNNLGLRLQQHKENIEKVMMSIQGRMCCANAQMCAEA